MTKNSQYTIYTDGGCKPNPGPGGWGAVIIKPDTSVTEISGSVQHTTNNRMELLAAIEALKTIKTPQEVNIFTDSKYLKNGIDQWLPAWQKRGWLTAMDTLVKNQDLWQRLEKLVKRHTIKWQWVKGHSGDQLNQKADHLARTAINIPPLPLLDKKAIHIFTAVSVSKKWGSWSAILRFRDKVKALSGSVPLTTGNRMHIHAAIAGLASVKRSLPIHVYTYSGYLKDGATQWARQWSRNNWLTRDDKPVSHKDLWQELNDYNKLFRVSWHLADKTEPPCEMQEAKILAQEAIQEIPEL